MGFENREYYRDDERPSLRFTLPKLNKLFLAIAGTCLIVFILQKSIAGFTAAFLLSSNLGLDFTQPWRFLSHQYMHADAGHLFFNMLGLFFFLPWLESRWGWKKTLGFYTLGGLFAAFTYLAFCIIAPQYAGRGALGASGCLFAVLGACALFYPDRQVVLFFFPVTVRALAFLYALFFLLSSLADKDFADAAHLGGLVFGYFAPYVAGPKLRDAQESWERRKQQRETQLVQNEQAEIDRILAKVSEQGMHSLTRGEQKALKQATERQQKRDAARR